MSARDFFRRHVFHNLSLKITALVLAAGLWLAVSSSPPSEVAIDVAIIFRNMPSNIEISSEKIPSAQIRVRGPEAMIRRLQASDIRAEIDLTGIKPGERTFDLTHQITVPDRLEVSQVVPSEIHVAFDTRATRYVPVQARVTGVDRIINQFAVARTEALIVKREPSRQPPEDFSIRQRLADRRNYRLGPLQPMMTVRCIEIVAFKMR
jgi:hypothetical protein